MPGTDLRGLMVKRDGYVRFEHDEGSYHKRITDLIVLRDPEPEEVACAHCGRIEEMEALADSCERRDCPLNALLDAVPIMKDAT